ncbi:MAG TPA: glycosyltransferase family 2 protein [Candidatus Fimivicinus intestinavium]|nr:glycosyltransferase family 2 protein [Candidatus Fimivicinus intestinavium]
MKKTVDLVVPCFNESDVLDLFYSEVSRILDQCGGYDFHYIFVDDGSRDQTLDILRRFAAEDTRVRYVSFSRNFGKESAMLAGMKYSTAEYVGILDADLQHSPDLIPQMLAALDEGYDIAAARRVDRSGEGRVKSAFSRAFYKVINRMSDVDIAEGAQDFRVMRRPVVEAILSMPEYNRFSKGIFSWVGFRTKWFAHENRERAAGQSKWSFSKLFRYALDGIIGFSTVPLKVSLYVGVASSGIGILYALYILIRTLLRGSDVPGYPSIICAIFFFGGLILCSLGVIGEYLARIYMEVKHRPSFLVAETNILPEPAEKSGPAKG